MFNFRAQGGDPSGAATLRPEIQHGVLRKETDNARREGGRSTPLEPETEGSGFDFAPLPIASPIAFALGMETRRAETTQPHRVGSVHSMTARPEGNARHIGEILASMGYRK